MMAMVPRSQIKRVQLGPAQNPCGKLASQATSSGWLSPIISLLRRLPRPDPPLTNGRRGRVANIS
jgi:hypothetical protein